MGRLALAPSDLVVIGGYFLLVIWIGLYFRNRMSPPEDDFAGGHKVLWWLAGVFHYMSSFSAFSFVAYAQMGYLYGWVAVTFFWVTVPACILGGLLFARAWRRANVITPVEFLERRFNVYMYQVFAWAGLPLLAALVVRKLSWQGALTGFIFGLVSGFVMLGAKAWYLPHVNLEWVRSGWDVITILVNASMTMLGMYAGTLAFGTTSSDRQRVAAFFREFDQAGTMPLSESSEYVYLMPISKITMAVGVLLAAAGFIGKTRSARNIDVLVAFILMVLGAVLFYRSVKRRNMARSEANAGCAGVQPTGEGSEG
jgi:Sodium:solute symporter family